jgi:hypothetical protein
MAFLQVKGLAKRFSSNPELHKRSGNPTVAQQVSFEIARGRQ